MLGSLLADLVSAYRGLVRNRRFAATVVPVLACGIAIATVLLSVINYYFVRPLPVSNPSELARVGVVSQMSNVPTTVPYDVFELVRENRSVVRDASAFSAGDVVLMYPTERAAQRRFVGVTSDNYFTFLGIRPERGRFYSAASVRAGTPEVVLSHAAWRRYFRAEDSAIGRTIALNGQPFVVAAVAPEGFQGTEAFREVDAYIPAKWLRLLAPPAVRDQVRGVPGSYRLLVRLRPDVAPHVAAAALTNALARTPQAEPSGPQQARRFVVIPELRSRPDMALAGVVMRIASGMAALVLLLLGFTALTVINLTVLRAIDRQGEFTLRSALGATPGRLVVYSLLEGIIVGGAAFVLGAALAQPIMRWVSAQHFGAEALSAPPIIRLAAEPWVYALAAFIAVAAAAGTSAAIGLRLRRLSASNALQAGGRLIASGPRRLWGGRVFVAAQVVASVVLFATAWMLYRAGTKWSRVDLGFDPRGAVVGSADLLNSGYDPARGGLLLERWVRDVRALPGVESAALAHHVPLSPNPLSSSVRASRDGGRVPALREIVSEGYFQTLRIPVRAGRPLLESDRKGAPRVAVVNQTLAQRLFPNGGALGRRILLGSTDTLDVEIVGVAQDAKYLFANEPPTPVVYLALPQFYSAEVSVIARGRPLGRLADDIRESLARIDNAVAVYDVAPLETVVSGSPALTMMRMAATFAAAFAALAATQVFLGLYAVVAFDVARRRREYGLRLALGEPRSSLVGTLVLRGARLAALGILLGVWPAVLGLKRIQEFFPPDRGAILGSLGVAAGLILVGASLASLVGARGILRVQPAEALKELA